MTPYTDRERRANLAKRGPDAYPGQTENILHSLKAHDVERAAIEREQAAVARAGGRLLTEKLAYRVDDFRKHYVTLPTGKALGEHIEGETPIWIAALRGDLGPEKLQQCWTNMIDAAGGNGKEGWRWAAEHRAGAGSYPDRGREDPQVTAVLLFEAEAMLDWPIYRAAMQAQTYADLWSQAGEGEERVLDTLARCSGITTPVYLIPGTSQKEA